MFPKNKTWLSSPTNLKMFLSFNRRRISYSSKIPIMNTLVLIPKCISIQTLVVAAKNLCKTFKNYFITYLLFCNY